VVDIDEVVDLLADFITDRRQVSTAHRPSALHTPRRDRGRRTVEVQRRPLVDLHEDAIGRQAHRVWHEVHVDIQVWRALQAKRLVFGEDRNAGVPELLLDIRLELLRGEPGSFALRR